MFDLYVSTNLDSDNHINHESKVSMNIDSDNRINHESKVSLSFDSELICQKELTKKGKKIVNLIIFIP